MIFNRLWRLAPAFLRRALTSHDLWFRSKANLLARPLYSGIGSILMLHRVCREANRPRLGFNRLLEVTPELLEEAIVFLKKKYEFVSLDQVYEILNGGKRKSKFIAVTMDDGYLDNYTHAFPILKKYNVPFTIYVTT